MRFRIITFTPFTDIMPDCSFKFAPLAQAFPAIPDAMTRFTFVVVPDVMSTRISGSSVVGLVF
jgi:hypothetical protein